MPNLGAVVTLFGVDGLLVPDSERSKQRGLCIFGEGVSGGWWVVVSGYYGG